MVEKVKEPGNVRNPNYKMNPLNIGNDNLSIINGDGNVWVQGLNEYCQLGLDTETKKIQIPTQVPNLCQIMSVATGQHHTLFLGFNGCVWSCGKGFCGQLGLGQKQKTKTPEIVPNLPSIVKIQAGCLHSLFLDDSDSVWCCGDNFLGQLGIEGVTEKVKNQEMVPIKNTSLPQIKDISAGHYYSLFLDIEGNVWGAGDNQNSQLGMENVGKYRQTKKTSLTRIKQISAGERFTLFLDLDGAVWGCGSFVIPIPIPTRIGNSLPPIQTVMATKSILLALDVEGKVWVTESPSTQDFSQLDIPSVTNVFAKYRHILLLDVEGTVWRMGGLGHEFTKSLEIVTDVPKIYHIPASRTKSARNFV